MLGSSSRRRICRRGRRWLLLRKGGRVGCVRGGRVGVGVGVAVEAGMMSTVVGRRWTVVGSCWIVVAVAGPIDCNSGFARDSDVAGLEVGIDLGSVDTVAVVVDDDTDFVADIVVALVDDVAVVGNVVVLAANAANAVDMFVGPEVEVQEVLEVFHSTQIAVGGQAVVAHTKYTLLVEKSIHNSKQLDPAGEESIEMMDMRVKVKVND